MEGIDAYSEYTFKSIKNHVSFNCLLELFAIKISIFVLKHAELLGGQLKSLRILVELL